MFPCISCIMLQNIEHDVKTGCIWRYNKSTEKQSHLSILQAEAAPLPPIPPGPSALKALAQAGAFVGHDIEERSAQLLPCFLHQWFATRFSWSDWQTFDAELSCRSDQNAGQQAHEAEMTEQAAPCHLHTFWRASKSQSIALSSKKGV